MLFRSRRERTDPDHEPRSRPRHEPPQRLVAGHEKRLAFAGTDAAGTVDPVIPGADYTRIEDVPLTSYDAALVCTPDEPKVSLLTYLLGHGKHVLVEKPLVAADDAALEGLKALSARTGAVCYTAYNHRFEIGRAHV